MKKVIFIILAIILFIIIISSCVRVDESEFKKLANNLNDDDELTIYMNDVKISNTDMKSLEGYNFLYYTLAAEATDEFIELDKTEKYDVFLKLIDTISKNNIKIDFLDCGKKKMCQINNLQLKYKDDIYEYYKHYYDEDSNLTLNGEEIYKPKPEYVNTPSQDSYESKNDSSITTQEKQAPTIGMTDYEVIESTWGRPTKVNKTESINGIREQWVYDRGYLYFEDHYLVSIQSSR